MKKKSRYFLSIGDKVIDLSTIPEFYDSQIDSFIGIVLFTSLFRDEMHLLKGLESLGLGINYEIPSIEVVKRSGTKKEGYMYSLASQDILYNDGFDLLTLKSVQSFLQENRREYEAIKELLNMYEEDLIRLRTIFSHQIKVLGSKSGKEEDIELQDEITSKNKSFNNIGVEVSVVRKLKELVNMLSSDEYKFDRDTELRYMGLLDQFAKLEVTYISKKGREANIKGLSRFASRIALLLRMNPSLKKPKRVEPIYTKDRMAILNAYETAVINNHELLMEDAPIDEKVEEPSFVDESLSEGEPDDYMLLEPDDLVRLSKSGTSNITHDDLDDTISQLEEQQGKRRGI